MGNTQTIALELKNGGFGTRSVYTGGAIEGFLHINAPDPVELGSKGISLRFRGVEKARIDYGQTSKRTLCEALPDLQLEAVFKEKKLQGQHTIPFTLHLPYWLNLPPTCHYKFDNRDFSVVYKLCARLNVRKMGNVDLRTSQIVFVSPAPNPQQINQWLQPVEMSGSQTVKTAFLFSRGVLVMRASLPRQVFEAQERVNVTIWVTNNSDVEVDALKIRLYRIIVASSNKRVPIETRLVDRREPRTFKPKSGESAPITVDLPLGFDANRCSIESLLFHCRYNIKISAVVAFAKPLSISHDIQVVLNGTLGGPVEVNINPQQQQPALLPAQQQPQQQQQPALLPAQQQQLQKQQPATLLPGQHVAGAPQQIQPMNSHSMHQQPMMNQQPPMMNGQSALVAAAAGGGNGQSMYPEIKLSAPQSAVNPASVNSSNAVNDFAARLAGPSSKYDQHQQQDYEEEDLEDYSHLGAPPAYEEPEEELLNGHTPASAPPVAQSEPEKVERAEHRVPVSSHAPELVAPSSSSASAFASSHSAAAVVASGGCSAERKPVPSSSSSSSRRKDSELSPSERKFSEAPIDVRPKHNASDLPSSEQKCAEAPIDVRPQPPDSCGSDAEEDFGGVLDLPEVPQTVPKDWSPQVAAAVSNERQQDIDDGFAVHKPVVAMG